MARHIVRFADLVACARRVGVKVVEAPSSHRGKVGEMGTVVGVTCHWTGTGLSFSPSSEYPDYNVVKEGRAGLNNSLSAFGLGRNSTIYVFSEDLSYHAGTWSFGGTTDGNGHYLGIEAAGAGTWTAWQRRVYPRLVASILLFIDAPASMAPTHAMGAMPRGRKSDFPVSDRGWLPDVTGGLQFHDAVAWLMRNPNHININYRASGTTPVAPKPAPVEDALMAVTEKDFDALVAKIDRLVDALLVKEYQRMGVLPTDSVQKTNFVGLARLTEGHALQHHRLSEDIGDDVDLLVGELDEAPPADPPPPPAV
jgi:hypothetical protein